MSGRGFHTRKIFWTAVSAALLFFTAAVIATPFLVNSDYVKERISKAVQSKAGIDASFSEVSVSFFPGFHVALSGIRTRQDGQQAGEIDSLLVYPDISSLFKGRLVVDKVVLQDVEAGKLIEKLRTEKVSSGKALSLLSIRDALFQFEPFISSEKGIVIVLENFTTRFFKGVDTSVRLQSVNGSITGTVLLKNLDMKGEYLQTFIPGNRALLSASTDTAKIRFAVDEKGRLAGDCEFNDLVFYSAQDRNLTLDPEKMTVKFDMSPTKSKIHIKADSLAPVLQKPEISFVRMPDLPSTNLKFSAEKVNINPAEIYAAAFIGDNIVSRNIFRIIDSGVSPAIEVKFETSNESGLFHPKNLTIKGSLQTGTVNIPETDLTARNVSGSAFMKDGTLDLEVAQGNVENSGIYQGTVTVDLISGPEVPFTSRLSLNADLKKAPAALSRLIDNETFAGEMKRVTVSEGSAVVDLFLEKRPEKELTIEVTAKDIRLEGTYDRMHDRIEIFEGSFCYKNKTARIDHMTARSGGSYIYDACMEFRLSPEPTADIRSGKALLQIKEIFPYLQSLNAFPLESIPFSPQSGTIWVDSLNLALPFKKKEKQIFRMTGKAKDIQAASGKGKEADCVLSFDFTVSGDQMSFSDLTGRVEDIQPVFELSGLPFVKGIRAPFEITGGKMEIESAELFFTGMFDFPSGPAVELSVRRNEPDVLILEHLSVIDQPATRFNFWNSDKKNSFEGFLSSSSLKKLFTHRFLEQKDIFQSAGENHFLISEGRDTFLKLEAYHLDLTPAMTQKNTNRKIRQWFQDKPILIKARYLDTGRYRLNKVTAMLDIKPDKTVIHLRKGDFCGIEIKGTVMKKRESVEFRADAAARKREDLQQTAECLFNGKTLIDGSYSFEGLFHAKTSMERLKEMISGNFELSASNGRIYRLTLLSRILSVINVSKFLKGRLPDLLQDGFAYNTFSLKADVKNSRIQVKEGIIDGTDMSIIFTGEIYPVRREINLTFLVAPFKTVDLIVKKIPVLSTLLGGKLVSIPVKAEGSMNQPAVIPLHPSAVSTGLTNLMKNIVNAPVKLMEKLP